MLTLPQAAAKNDPSIQGQVQALIQGEDAPILTRFLNEVKTNGRVSINIGLTQLVEVLHSGEYQNMFELGFSLEAIRNRYDSREQYAAQLEALIQVFPDVKQGKYGLLNLGNRGIPYPGFGGGNICIVLRQNKLNEADRKQKVACLKKFSLAYFSRDGKLDEQLWQEISTYMHLGELALLKHKNQIRPLEGNWADMVANSSNFLEIILYNKIPIAEFEEIRVKRAFFREMSSLETSASTTLRFVYDQWKEMLEQCQLFSLPIVQFD